MAPAGQPQRRMAGPGAPEAPDAADVNDAGDMPDVPFASRVWGIANGMAACRILHGPFGRTP